MVKKRENKGGGEGGEEGEVKSTLYI